MEGVAGLMVRAIIFYYTLSSAKKESDMNKLLTMTTAAGLLMAIAVLAADPNEKTVFVTSASYNGNLGGLAGADAKCQAEAEGSASVVPSGTYMAWLSDGIDSPDTRFTKSSHPYILPNGKKIAEDYIDLTDGSILRSINLDPTGQPVGYQEFWTGTNPDGTADRDDDFFGCGRWAVEPVSDTWAIVGHSSKKSSVWSHGNEIPCRRTLKLACFQQ